MNTTAVKSAAAMPKGAEPVKLLGRIGSKAFEVTVYFSDKSKETMGDKILRMIEREAAENE